MYHKAAKRRIYGHSRMMRCDCYVCGVKSWIPCERGFCLQINYGLCFGCADKERARIAKEVAELQNNTVLTNVTSSVLIKT
jgi:hypothetical protein